MFVFYFISFVAAVNAIPLPDFVKLCSKKDPNFHECVAKGISMAISGFKTGNKELGVPVLEPFFVEKMDILGTGSGSIKLDQKYKNVNYYGMADAEISNLKIDFENLTWEMDALNKKIEMLSDYQMNGQLLIFPINGHGKGNTTLIDMLVHYKIKLAKYEKNGKTHLKMDKIKMDMKPGKVHLKFENLLPGNEKMSQELSNTIDENSEIIFQDVKASFENVFQQIYKNIADKFFSIVPMDEIFLE